MTPLDKQRILDAVWGDAYTDIHAVVIFQNDGRILKFKRIYEIVLSTQRDTEVLKALWDWQENEQARINAQGDEG